MEYISFYTGNKLVFYYYDFFLEELETSYKKGCCPLHVTENLNANSLNKFHLT